MKAITMAKVEEMVVVRYQIKSNQTAKTGLRVFNAGYSGGNVIQLSFYEHLPSILYVAYINSIRI